MSLAAINRVRALKKERLRRLNKKNKTIDLSSYKDKPIEFFHEILGVKLLTEQQKQICLSVRDNQTTNVQAAHGIGKSFLAACLILYFTFAVGGTAVSTAPTHNQVNDILWKEVRNIYDKNKKKLGGRRTELSIKTKNTDNKIVTSLGRSARNYDSSSFQGLHDEYLLLIQDEADGITDTIDEAFESCLTGSKNRGVRIGNPLNARSAFAKNCAISNIKIPVWDHVNVAWAYQEVIAENGKAIHRLKPAIALKILKPEPQRRNDPVKPQDEWDEDLPRDVIPGAVSIAWIEKVRVKYGEFSAYWMSRIEAEFPGDDVAGIVPRSWLVEARERYDENPNYWDEKAKQDRWRIGVDVSDGGDRHAIAVWRGAVLYSVKIIQPKDDREDVIKLATDHVEPLVNTLGGMFRIAVDNTGVGAGTLAQLKIDSYNCTGCKFGESAEDKKQYRNRKIELFWQLREDLRLGEIAIAPLGEVEDEVFEEIAAVRYKSNTEKQIECEPKSETIKRLKRSPDAGDAVITAGETKRQNLESQEKEPDRFDNEEDRLLAKLIEESRNRDYMDITSEEANEYFQ